MKILFISHYPNPLPASVWTRISFFAQFLKEKGHNVSINGSFSLTSLGKFGIKNWHGLKLCNVTPIIMSNNTFSLIFNIISSIVTSFFIIIINHPDVIVITVPKGDAALGSCIVSSALKKKIIIDYRDEWEDFRINNAKTKNYKKLSISLKKHMTKFYQKSNHVIATTENMIQSLSKRGIKNVKLISNGADINIFKPYNKKKIRQSMNFDENDFIFVYSGGIAGYYRLDLVVIAIEKLIRKKANVKFLLAGRGNYVKELKNLIKNKHLDKNIIYLGEVSEKIDLAKLLSASDVGIIPYDANPLWKNTIPSKALEYFACGLPAVATTYPDSILGKLILENHLGLISEPENIDALAVSLEKIYNDQLFVKQVQQSSYKIIHEKFDRNKIALEFLKLIEE